MRVAVVGMDGTGKTTMVRRLADEGGFSVVYTIRPHDDPASPDAGLSRHLTLASAAADAVGRAQLKVAVFARQLLLYGPAERRALELGFSEPGAGSGTAPVVLADRHPLGGERGRGGDPGLSRRWAFHPASSTVFGDNQP
jgi:hypothetical protein